MTIKSFNVWKLLLLNDVKTKKKEIRSKIKFVLINWNKKIKNEPAKTKFLYNIPYNLRLIEYIVTGNE